MSKQFMRQNILIFAVCFILASYSAVSAQEYDPSHNALATMSAQKESATAESPTSHLAVGAGVLLGIAVGYVVAKRYLSKKK